MTLIIIPFRTARIAWLTLIPIGLFIILDIVSFSIPWLTWGTDATPWAVRFSNDDTWYQMDAQCSVRYHGQSVTFYTSDNCRYWNAIRAMIMLGFLSAAVCGILLFLFLLVPKYTQRLSKGLLVWIMLVSWVFNIIGLSVFVGYAVKAVNDANSLLTSSIRAPTLSFPWEGGFILLILVIILQMGIIAMLFPATDALNAFRLPAQDQMAPMLGTYQPPHPAYPYPYPYPSPSPYPYPYPYPQQPYGAPPPSPYSGVPPAAASPALPDGYPAYPPYPYPPAPASTAAPSAGWPYPPHPQAPTLASFPHPQAVAPTVTAPPTSWPYPPPEGWPYPQPPNMTTPAPAGGLPYPPYPYPYPYHATHPTTSSPSEVAAPAPAPVAAGAPSMDVPESVPLIPGDANDVL